MEEFFIKIKRRRLNEKSRSYFLKEERHYYFTIFIASFCMFFLEMLMPKILQSLHVVDNVLRIIPVTMLGIAIGGLFSFIFFRRIETHIDFLLIAFPLTIILSFLATIFLRNIFLLSLIISLPFFISSIIISFGFFKFNSFKVYFYNLLGSGIGVIGVFFLLPILGGENCIIFVSIIAVLGFFTHRKINLKHQLKNKLLIVMGILIFILLASCLVINLKTKFLDLAKIGPCNYPENSSTYLSQQKSARCLLKNQSNYLLYTQWNLMSRVDILNFVSNNNNITAIFHDDIIWSGIVTQNKAPINVCFSPFYLFKNPSVLIIGTGGGIDIAQANGANASRIVGVEINPSTVRFMQNEMANYSQHIYNKAEIHNLDGRTYVHLAKEKFEIIYLNWADLATEFPKAYVSMENYLYTKEAFIDYLNHLNENGVISIRRGAEGFDLMRAISSALAAFEELGIKNPEFHFFITEERNYDPYVVDHSGVLLIKKSAFTLNETNILEQNLNNNIVLYNPYNVSENKYSKLVLSKNREEFYNKFSSDVFPITDDRPFFYEYDKNHRIVKEITFVFLRYALVILLILLISIIKFRKDLLNFIFLSAATYVALLGVGYMFFEIFLIQKFNLFLGSPILSMSIVLMSLMIFGGIGSKIASRLKKGSIIMLMAVLFLAIIFSNIVLKEIFGMIAHQNIYLRTFSSFLILAPVCILMGIPFPTIMERIKKRIQTKYVMLLWAVSGLFSLIGSVASLYLSIINGFNFIAIIAGFAYAIAAIFLLTFD